MGDDGPCFDRQNWIKFSFSYSGWSTKGTSLIQNQTYSQIKD